MPSPVALDEDELSAGPVVAESQGDDNELSAGPSGDGDLSAGPTSGTVIAAPKKPEKSAEEYANMPISDVLSEAASNLGPSAMTAYKGLAHAVMNPSETLEAAKQIGSGLYSKAQGAVGVKQDAAEKKNTESLVDALGQHYKEAYGTSGGFKKALATDPFSIGMDISSVVPVLGGAARTAGLTAEATGMLGKAASVAGQAASMMDPVQLALAAGKGAAGAAGKVADWGLTGTQSALSGVPMEYLQVIHNAASSGTPEQIAVYKRFHARQGAHTEIAQTANNAIDELEQRAVDSYLSNKNNLATATNQLPMDDILEKLKDLNDFTGFGTDKGRFNPHQNAVADVNNQIIKTLNSSDPTSRTMLDLDNLKQSLNNVAGGTSGAIQGKIGEIAKAVRDTIANPKVGGDPIYAKMMDDYGAWKDKLKDYQSALVGTNKTAATIQVGRMMKAIKTGPKSDLLKELSSTEAGKNLPYMLAGAATAPWLAQGVRGSLEYPAGVIAAAMQPASWVPLAHAAAASSPKLSGKIQYGIGAAKRALTPVTNTLGAATSRPVTYGATRLGEAEEERQGHARGGSVMSHEVKADRLVRAAEAAKKSVNQTTEPLLNLPDETIVKALDVAQQAI